MEYVVQLISKFGLEVALCAVVTTVFVGIVKMPLKKIAQKSKNGKGITKYITFLPVVFGFVTVLLFTYLENRTVAFNRLFFTRWIGAVSASLAIYAFWEKFVPSKKKILSETEIAANREVICKIESLISQKEKCVEQEEYRADEAAEGCSIEVGSENPETGNDRTVPKKIVLKGGRHAEIT